MTQYYPWYINFGMKDLLMTLYLKPKEHRPMDEVIHKITNEHVTTVM